MKSFYACSANSSKTSVAGISLFRLFSLFGLISSIATMLVCAGVQAAEIAASDILKTGIALYERGDYVGAQNYLLKAVSGEFKSVAVAHYYLANTLMHSRKTNAALDEYQVCYNLAPYSSFSGYCRMMLLRHGRNPDGNKDAKQEEKTSSSAKKAPDEKTKAGEQKRCQEQKRAEAEAKPVTDPEVKKLSSRLPRLVLLPKESPPAEEIMQGNIYVRSGFIGDAENRKARALERLEQSRQILTKAESLTHSFVPTHKAFGESDEEFKKRREEAEKTVSSLLDPYRENAKEAETAFQTESALLESCINASRGYQY